MATDITGLLNQFLGGQVGNLDPSKLTSLPGTHPGFDQPERRLAGTARQVAGRWAGRSRSTAGSVRGTSEPISADQLSDALGEENVDKAAASAGVSPSDLASGPPRSCPAWSTS